MKKTRVAASGTPQNAVKTGGRRAELQPRGYPGEAATRARRDRARRRQTRPFAACGPSWRRRLARIDELQASADTDCLLEIPNRRGFERELHRAIAYIKRYRASGALIVLDVDRLKADQRYLRPCRGRSGAEDHRGDIASAMYAPRM